MAKRTASAIGRGSKNKGSNFERKLATQIREAIGAPADRVTRTPLSGGMYERGDIIVKDPYTNKFPWFVEARNRESWGTLDSVMKNPTANVPLKWFMEDAVGKCHPYDGRLPRKPLLIFTRNQNPVYVMFYYADLVGVRLTLDNELPEEQRCKLPRVLPKPKPYLILEGPDWNETGDIMICLWSDFLALFKTI